MKQRIAVLLLILIAMIMCVLIGALDAARAEDEGYWVLCMPDSMVNVREAPRKDARVTAWVMFGEYVRTDGKTKNGFVHVTGLAAEEPDGWIHSGYLVWDPPRAETYTAVVWGGRVIARTCVDGKKKCVLREGRTVTVYARCNRWAVTNKGFVMCDWLREAE